MALPHDNKDPEEPAEESRKLTAAPARRSPVSYWITFEQGYLSAELAHRETVEEMRGFLRSVVRDSARCPVVLIRVRESKPLFHVERDGLLECLLQIARAPQHRVALLADGPDLHASHEYLELVARQRGVRVRSFRTEGEALGWLKDRRVAGERRRDEGARPASERRDGADRRRSDRRARPAA